MTAWARSHPYTMLAAGLLTVVTAGLVLTGHPWWQCGLPAAYFAVQLALVWREHPRSPQGARERRSWQPVGRRQPCPPQCHIRVAHEHHRLRWQ